MLLRLSFITGLLLLVCIFAAAHFYDFHSWDEKERATSAPRSAAYPDAANSQRVCLHFSKCMSLSREIRVYKSARPPGVKPQRDSCSACHWVNIPLQHFSCSCEKQNTSFCHLWGFCLEWKQATGLLLSHRENSSVLRNTRWMSSCELLI